MKRYTQCADLASLTQRMFRLQVAALTLVNTTIKILERTTLHYERPEAVDIAEVVDAIHTVFNRFQQCTKVSTWHDDELDERT